jgi:outer membrane murein-binding lipoprotein Lpp
MLMKRSLTVLCALTILAGCSKSDEPLAELRHKQELDALRSRVSELEAKLHAREAVPMAPDRMDEKYAKLLEHFSEESRILRDVTGRQNEQIAAMVFQLEGYVAQISAMSEPEDGDDQVNMLRQMASDTWAYLNQEFPDRGRFALPGSP